jgi:hypothetical protein
MKKRAILFSAILFQTASMFAQSQTYDNSKGAKSLHYGEKTGTLDSLAENPAPGNVNSNKKCVKYVRNKDKKFDVLKMNFTGKLSDSSVSAYATYLGTPPKLKMKLYTNAPVGTLVEILLGNKSGNKSYPAGTHSQYQAYTTVTNSWEELEFKFSQIPKGSETPPSEIDQMTLLFNPNSSTSDTYYFSDITGPVLTSKKMAEVSTTPKVDVKKVTGNDQKNTKAPNN